MKIRKITLKNWKNFAQVEAEISDRVFLVGPNASGKSNFLDAFRFLRDVASTRGGFQEAVGRRGGVSALRCLSARRYSDVTVGVVVEDGSAQWRYELSFNQDNQRQPLLRREVVCRGDEVLLNRPSLEDRDDLARLTQTYLEQVNVNRPFRELATFFASIRYLHIVPQLVREPDRSIGRTNDPFGGDFLEQIAKTPDKAQKARLRHIQEALRLAVPQLQEIQLFLDFRGVPHVRGRYKHWRPQGAWQTEEQFSDGTIRLLGLLWMALDKGGPLLLEEPELQLHPGIVQVLPQMFARVQRRTGRQIFLSTHSPDLLHDKGIGLDEVLLLKPTPEGTVVSPAGAHEEIGRLLEEDRLSLADVVMPHTKPEQAAQLALFGER